MKAAALTMVGGITTAAATAGPPFLIGLGAALLIAAGVYCWTVVSRSRTTNTVRIIGALRSPVSPAGRARTVGRRRQSKRSVRVLE